MTPALEAPTGKQTFATFTRQAWRDTPFLVATYMGNPAQYSINAR
jgi:hypothetical protein